MSTGRLNALAAAAVTLIVLAVYLATVAPNLTFWDSGEYITCAVTMGVPHPPGSPLLVLAGRVLSLLPVPDLRGGGFDHPAFRVNLIGVASGTGLALLTFLILLRLIARVRPRTGRARNDWPSAVAAAVPVFLAAFSHQVWVNATETETYLPALFLSVAALWSVLKWRDRAVDAGAVRWLLFAAYLLGLGTAIHLSALLVAPALGIIVLTVVPRRFADPAVWAAGALAGAAFLAFRAVGGAAGYTLLFALLALIGPAVAALSSRNQLTPRRGILLAGITAAALFGAGYTVYPTVAVRAAKNPAIDMGAPDTLARYNEYLARAQYDRGDFAPGPFERQADIGYQFGFMYLRYLLQQFPSWGPTPTATFTNDRAPDAPGQAAMVTDTAPLPILLFALLLAGMLLHARRDPAAFAALFAYALVTSAGLGLYMNFANPETRERDYFFLGSYWAAMLWTGFGALWLIGAARTLAVRLDRPRLALPVQVAAAMLVLTTAPAAVLSRHLEPPRTNWNVHDNARNDLPYDYGRNILASCAPDAILFTHGDNDTYTVWYQQEVEGFRRDVSVINLSILNAPWYIRQLRGRGLPITVSDRYINDVLGGGSLAGYRERTWPVEGRVVTRGGITWTMPPTEIVPGGPGGRTGVLSAAAIMTAHIIDGAGGRPVYFTVATPPSAMIGLARYMATEGMVFRLTPESSERRYHFAVDALEHNLFEVYRFRGVADSTVYRTERTDKLLGNYFFAFLDLAEAYFIRGEADKALKTADAGLDTCAPGREGRLLLIALLDRYDSDDAARELAAKEYDPADADGAMQFGADLLAAGAADAAGSLFRAITERLPDYALGWQGYAAALVQEGRLDEALAAVDSLAAHHPGDPQAGVIRDWILHSRDAGADTGEVR